MAKQDISEGEAFDAFSITPSDTLSIAQDAGNTLLYKHCFLHNPATGGTVRVRTAGSGAIVTIYIPQGDRFPLAVSQVFATTPTPPSGLVGLVVAK
jgi:hypothetical protein